MQVLHLDKRITKQQHEIKDLNKKLEEKQKKLKIREYYLIEILRQFQKFINFVLKATPTQAEFLLNIERITRLELNDAVSLIIHKLRRQTYIFFSCSFQLNLNVNVLF